MPLGVSGTIGAAEGSALARVGNTSVAAGIQCLVTYPSEARPTDGSLEVNVHLSALCSSRFHATRQSDEALALSQFLKRTLLGSGALDLSSLAIKSGQSVWLLRADVVCLDFDGNVADAALLALVGALRQLRLPVPIVTEDGEVTMKLGDHTRLAPLALPVSLSFACIHGQLITDPTAEEEALSSTAVCVAVTSDGKLCGVHKAGGSPLSPDQLEACVVLAKQRVELVETLVAKATPP